jgi:NAD(P)H dehydrogenase (quinone)
VSSRILIAFYSRNGSVEALAKAVGAGAQAEGAEVRLRRARELVSEELMGRVPGWLDNARRMNALYEAPSEDDAVWADGIAFGSPTRFGGAASELRAYIDGLGALWGQGKLYGKAGGAFTATSTLHGGNETTVLSFYPTMAHLGLVIVPPGFGAPAMFKAGTPYGASSVSFGGQNAPPTEDDLAAAEFQGRRLAQVAKALSRG